MFVRSWPAAVDVLWRPNVHESDAPKSAERKVSGWAQRNLSAGKTANLQKSILSACEEVEEKKWLQDAVHRRLSMIGYIFTMQHVFGDIRMYWYTCLVLGMFKEIGWWVNPHAGPGTNDPAALPDHWIGTGIGCHSKTHLRIKFHMLHHCYGKSLTLSVLKEACIVW